jgi:hypothetical protein
MMRSDSGGWIVRREPTTLEILRFAAGATLAVRLTIGHIIPELEIPDGEALFQSYAKRLP